MQECRDLMADKEMRKLAEDDLVALEE